jgi:hypothetical protein
MEKYEKIYILAIVALGVLAFTLGFQPAYASTEAGVAAIQTTLTDSGYIATVTQVPGNTGYTVTVAGLADAQTMFLNALGATAGAMVTDGSYGDISSVGVVTSEHTGFLYLITESEAQQVIDMYAKGNTYAMGVYGLTAYNAATPMYF